MKGISGKVLAVIATLLIALFALAILFGLMNQIKPVIINILETLMEGLKNKLKEFCRAALGPLGGVLCGF